MRKKKLLAFFLASMMVLALTACGGGGKRASKSASDGTIHLTLWGAEGDQDYLRERVKAFKEAFPEKVFDIQIGVESENSAKDTILTDVQAAADVYAFASDQITDLVNGGALLDLGIVNEALIKYAGKDLEDIKRANIANAVEAVSVDEKLYAFPFAIDGYFMFYDPDYITPEQAQNWDTLLDAAQAGGKKVGMVLASGWYNASFFYGAGFTTALNPDGTTSIDWNGTAPNGVTGVQVVQAMQKIAGHPAFMAVPDNGTSNQLASGSLCAVISGTWDTDVAASAFGDDFIACKLPAYNAGGTQVQTGSVSSYKCIGVNPYADEAGWAVMLAEFLTNEESQIARYEATQAGPSNIHAAASDIVSANKGIAGLSDQSAYGVVQMVGGKYWDPAKSFGEQIAQGTIPADEASIQNALDELVMGITAPLS